MEDGTGVVVGRPGVSVPNGVMVCDVELQADTVGDAAGEVLGRGLNELREDGREVCVRGLRVEDALATGVSDADGEEEESTERVPPAMDGVDKGPVGEEDGVESREGVGAMVNERVGVEDTLVAAVRVALALLNGLGVAPTPLKVPSKDWVEKGLKEVDALAKADTVIVGMEGFEGVGLEEGDRVRKGEGVLHPVAKGVGDRAASAVSVPEKDTKEVVVRDGRSGEGEVDADTSASHEGVPWVLLVGDKVPAPVLTVPCEESVNKGGVAVGKEALGKAAETVGVKVGIVMVGARD